MVIMYPSRVEHRRTEDLYRVASFLGDMMQPIWDIFFILDQAIPQEISKS
jgi:hypothetical protein